LVTSPSLAHSVPLTANPLCPYFCHTYDFICDSIFLWLCPSQIYLSLSLSDLSLYLSASLSFSHLSLYPFISLSLSPSISLLSILLSLSLHLSPLFLYLSTSLPLYLSISLSLSLSISISHPSIPLSLYLFSPYLSISPSLHLSHTYNSVSLTHMTLSLSHIQGRTCKCTVSARQMCQKRPVHVKRNEYMWKLSCTAKKRPMSVQKDCTETYVCAERDLCMCQKRPMYTQKETYVCAKKLAKETHCSLSHYNRTHIRSRCWQWSGSTLQYAAIHCNTL